MAVSCPGAASRSVVLPKDEVGLQLLDGQHFKNRLGLLFEWLLAVLGQHANVDPQGGVRGLPKDGGSPAAQRTAFQKQIGCCLNGC
jgi:hypothetical protein